MKNKLTVSKRYILVVATALILSIIASGSLSCNSKPEPIRIGLPPYTPAYEPVYVAASQGFFSANGLNATIKEYESGQAAVQGMLAGEMDIAGASEYPVVGNALNKDEIRIIASISQGLDFSIIGRKDRGIETVQDFKGKRIGVTFHTINEFYLGRFLSLNGIQTSEVTLVNLPLAKLEDALANGSVEAVVCREPYTGSIKKRLATSVLSWPIQSYQPTYALIVLGTDMVAQHPDTVKRFLTSIKKADEYIMLHQSEVKASIQKKLAYDDATMATYWSQLQFSLNLDQSLVVAMEDEARWMISNNLTSEEEVPFFNDYIYEDALKAVKPEAVNIIR